MVGDGLGDALGEQWFAVEGQQLLLDHPAHQPGGVGAVGAAAELAFESVGVEQAEEGLEVLLAA